MPRVSFMPNLQRYVQVLSRVIAADTARDSLDRVFEMHPELRGYVLDDLRRHVVVFVDDLPIRDSQALSQPVSEASEIAYPRNPDTASFVPAVKDECRVPVNGALVVNRTRDGGATIETLRDGLPQHDAYDLAYRHGMAIHLESETLAFGSTTGNLWVSGDHGNH